MSKKKLKVVLVNPPTREEADKIIDKINDSINKMYSNNNPKTSKTDYYFK